jgi:hypothetical protein
LWFISWNILTDLTTLAIKALIPCCFCGKQCCLYLIIIYLLTAIGLSPGGSGYFTCKQTWNWLLLNLKREGYMRRM